MVRKLVETVISDRGKRGRWGVVATLIGYVALVGYAVLAQPEYRPPIAQSRHTIQSSAEQKSNDDQQPSYPVATLKALRDAENAGEADCGTSEECRAKQRDYADLQAQWEAAKAAQGQLIFARWQTGIAAVGTLLVAIALIYTGKATTAAIEANRISREAYLADRRPWMSFIEIKPEKFAPGGTGSAVEYYFGAIWMNTGKSPAVRCSALCKYKILDISDSIGCYRFEMSVAEDQRVSIIAPGVITEAVYCTVPIADLVRVAERRARLFIWTRVEYHDAGDVGLVRHTEVCLEAVCITDAESTLAMKPVKDFMYPFAGPQNTLS